MATTRLGFIGFESHGILLEKLKIRGQSELSTAKIAKHFFNQLDEEIMPPAEGGSVVIGGALGSGHLPKPPSLIDPETGKQKKGQVRVEEGTVLTGSSRIGGCMPDVRFEEKYQHLICRPLNLDASVVYEYFSPNEANPQDMKTHLEKIKTPLEIIPNAKERSGVTTGANRAIFFLLLGDFDCVFGVDIEPPIKAFLDFSILLGRISNDRNEFFSFAVKAPLSEEAKKTIIQRIISSDMPKHMQSYYIRNFARFSKIFYSFPKDWIYNPSFSEVNYYMNDELFLKFKKYAQEGRFISVCSDINDLASFENVVAIDISNIYFYTFINPSLSPSSERPLIIWSTPKPRLCRSAEEAFDWNFYSYRCNAIDDQQHEMKQLMKTFSEAHSQDCLRLVFINALIEGKNSAALAKDHQMYDFWLSKLSAGYKCKQNIEDVGPPTSSSVQLHRLLKDYVQNNFYDASRFGLGMIDFGCTFELNHKLSEATPEQLENIFRDPNASKFLPQLIRLMIEQRALCIEKDNGWYNVKYIKGFEQVFIGYCESCQANTENDFDSYGKLFSFKCCLKRESLLTSFPGFLE